MRICQRMLLWLMQAHDIPRILKLALLKETGALAVRDVVPHRVCDSLRELILRASDAPNPEVSDINEAEYVLQHRSPSLECSISWFDRMD